jgi:hypothetical protein
MTASDRNARTLQVAEKVAAALSARGISTAVIGAIAAAVHGYVRSTDDVDLASNVHPFHQLRPAAEAFRAEGLDVRFGEPDQDDPLGGVLTITGEDFDPIQVVNFLNPFAGGSALGREAIETATPRALGSLAVVDLPHLIALKIYAGGNAGASDVLELLDRNPNADREAILDVCARHGLADDLERVLARK